MKIEKWLKLNTVQASFWYTEMVNYCAKTRTLLLLLLLSFLTAIEFSLGGSSPFTIT